MIKPKHTIIAVLFFVVVCFSSFNKLNIPPQIFKKVTFYGAELSYTELSKYYKLGSNFHHFTFQYKLRDVEKKDDEYEVVVYAIDLAGEIMNAGSPLSLIHRKDITESAKKGVLYHGNINLTRTKLDKKYKQSNANIIITPKQGPNNYIYFILSPGTKAQKIFVDFENFDINPSPPATRSEEEN